MNVTDLIYTYAKILEEAEDGNTDKLVGYALHIITEVTDCRYVVAGSKVNATPREDDVYEIELFINQDSNILHFPYITPLVHVINLQALELDDHPDRKMEIVVMLDGKKQDPTYPVDQPSPNEIRRPIK